MSNLDVNNIEDIYELSPMQQGMLLDVVATDNPGMYRVNLAYELQGTLDIDAFRVAWQQVAQRHAVVRISIHYEGLEKPIQVVHREIELPISVVDLRELAEDERQRQLDEHIDREANRSIELDTTPLMTLTLLLTSADRCWLIWNIHHILIEGWSAAIILKDALEIYSGLLKGETVRLEPVVLYRDYIQWMQQQDEDEVRAFWQQQLKGFYTPTRLHVEHGGMQKNSAVVDFDGVDVTLSVATTKALETFARQNQLTVNTLVRAAWALLLRRYSGMDDVLFGTMVAGRSAPISGIESIVGLFINLLPVRAQIPEQGTVLDWLKQIQHQQMEMSQHEHVGLTQIKAWSESDRNLPLFETMLIFENWVGDVVDWNGPLKVNDFRGSQVGQGYPLTAVVEPAPAMVLSILFDARRFDAETVKGLLEYFRVVLEAIPATAAQPVSELPQVTEADRQKCLFEWNGNGELCEGRTAVPRMFEAQVEQTPDAGAVTFNGKTLSYREVNERANVLARCLKQLGVGPNVLVGVMIGRSTEMVVTALAVMKAGGAYVPLDPNYPDERLGFVIEDTAMPVLISENIQAERLAGYGSIQTLYIDDQESESLLADAAIRANLSEDVAGDDLVYVIYTSGTTGKPKGTMVTHTNLASAYEAWEGVYSLRNGVSCHLQMANMVFDVFSGDLVRAMCSGGRLVIVPHELLLSPQDLYALMREQAVYYAEFVPAVFRELTQYLEASGQTLDFMKIVVVGSDSWYVSEYQHAKHLCGEGTRLINSYGLTEATIDSTYFEGRGDGLIAAGMVPIGKPFANTRTYVLDKNLRHVPIGVPGELCVSGAAVTRGYLNRDALTAERFVEHPYGDASDTRIYKTGDLVRYLPDGNIELLGRTDFQVKIRGFRVEIGEIENTLADIAGISECAVILREDQPGDKRLAAYLVSTAENAPSAADLRKHLRAELPDYMIPSVFIFLDQLPKNANQKVDRNALPKPELERQLDEVFVAPSSASQLKLLEMWREILGVEKIGVNDNFFDLGGHSLLMMRLRSMVAESFDHTLPLADLFKYATLEEQANLLDVLMQTQQGAGELGDDDDREEFSL